MKDVPPPHNHSDSSYFLLATFRLFLFSLLHHSDSSYFLPTTTPTLPTLSTPPLSFSPHHFSDSSYSLPITTLTLPPPPLRLFLLSPLHHSHFLPTTSPTLLTLPITTLTLPHYLSDSSFSLTSTTPTLFPEPLRLSLLTPHGHFDSDLTLTTTTPTLPYFKLLNSGAEKALIYFLIGQVMNETQNTWIIHFNTTKYYLTSRTFNVTHSTK